LFGHTFNNGKKNIINNINVNNENNGKIGQSSTSGNQDFRLSQDKYQALMSLIPKFGYDNSTSTPHVLLLPA